MRLSILLAIGLMLQATDLHAAIMCPTDKVKDCDSLQTPEGNPAQPVRCQDAIHCRVITKIVNGQKLCVFTCPVFLRPAARTKKIVE